MATFPTHETETVEIPVATPVADGLMSAADKAKLDGITEGGIIGPQGPEGPQGPQGEPGADGADGAQGLQGETGPQGLAGADGAPGADGMPGADGQDGSQGPQGIQGIQGVQGETGPAGPTGPQGPAGADGVGNQSFSLLVEPPPNTLGIDGDIGFYFPEEGIPARLWRKADGAWTFDRDLPF